MSDFDDIIQAFEEGVDETITAIEKLTVGHTDRVMVPIEGLNSIKILLKAQSQLIAGLKKDADMLRQGIQDTINRKMGKEPT